MLYFYPPPKKNCVSKLISRCFVLKLLKNLFVVVTLDRSLYLCVPWVTIFRYFNTSPRLNKKNNCHPRKKLVIFLIFVVTTVQPWEGRRALHLQPNLQMSPDPIHMLIWLKCGDPIYCNISDYWVYTPIRNAKKCTYLDSARRSVWIYIFLGLG